MWKGLWQNEYDMRFEISTHNSYRNRLPTSLSTSPIIGITSASPAGHLPQPSTISPYFSQRIKCAHILNFYAADEILRIGLEVEDFGTG